MEQDFKDILKYTESINKTIDELKKEKPKEVKVPSNIQILFSGVSNNIGVQTLFSDKVDSVLGKLFDNILSGNFDSSSLGVDSLEKILGNAGINNRSFEGELSQRLLNTIGDSISSKKFSDTKNNLKKCLLVLKDLKREVSSEKDKEKRKKLEDALYAIKKVLKITFKIYNQRKEITERVKKGLNVLINEEDSTDC